MIVVMVETLGDEVAEVSREALTLARRLGEPLAAVVVGGPAARVAEQLGAYGVEQAHEVTGDAFSAYAPAAWGAAVHAAAQATGASAVVASGTPRGNEVLAHVACRLDVAMAANVVAVESRDPLVVTRQVLGGAAMEEMRLEDATAVFSVAGHACEEQPADAPVACTVQALEVPVADTDRAAHVVRTEVGEAADAGTLKSAKVVVGAGRGAGSAGGFDDVLELAQLLNGSLGVSRVVTSLGWRPHHEQVGQTGSKIAPEVYIPCGISGAIQHWAGCSTAGTILAINTDPDAPMVTKAHYAVIGDMHEVVPAINAELRRRKG
ncbi:MAG: Electron transfer flavoprotein, alpha subunit [uncultured Nocardioidaceae bacterium]|uniref:Electron transfer flavoprotein, alpha subunit n=1 Tax=uncultured Nocardioidaceae bacterium TaxID=253824 RepID=A0A6J4KUW5_9ACTN|nr:MAG: Electron transfer flavoprotein, alpha subunit [uncultured Nocardioidaceae bacterium]